MDDRKKLLQQYANSLRSGMDSGDLYDIEANKNNPMRLALDSRNLSEEALAKQVLDNTGIPIPGKRASANKMEDFLQRIVSEQYPESKPGLMVLGEGSGDYYNPVTNDIGIDKKTAKGDIFNAVGAALHEGGHAHDKKVLGYNLPKELMTGDNAHLQMNKQNAYDALLAARREGLPDPTPEMLNEIASKGHHARIPNLRDADSYGLGALKSMLKSGTFKGVAPVLAKAGLATAGGMVSLASEAADSEIGGDAEGQAQFDRESNEYNRRKKAMEQATPEQQNALSSVYNNLDSPQTDARLQALKNYGKQLIFTISDQGQPITAPKIVYNR